MQLITALSAASALVATASARSAVQLNESCDHSKPLARIINRCPYDVYLWSVFKGDGCPSDQMVTLKTGETYSENYQAPQNGVGVSIKVSKNQQCKHQNLVQLEYYLEQGNPMYAYNYWDVSYVDCLDEDCPTKHEGFYAVAGTQVGKFASSAENTWCPILACNDPVSCAKLAYILPDDVQTKTCALDQNIDFYMCGGEAPNQDYSSPPVAPAPSSANEYKVDAAAVTPAPQAQEVEHALTKTHVEVVYATVTEYVKRHAHINAHKRHQQFHA